MKLLYGPASPYVRKVRVLALYDSRVICGYLDGLHDGTHLFPTSDDTCPE